MLNCIYKEASICTITHMHVACMRVEALGGVGYRNKSEFSLIYDDTRVLSLLCFSDNIL